MGFRWSNNVSSKVVLKKSVKAVRQQYIKASTDKIGAFSGFGNSSETNLSDVEGEYTCSEEKTGLQLFNSVFQPVVYSLVFLLGLAGNGLMLTVLLKRRGLLRITEIYLLHLALADLLLILTFPFMLAQTVTGWVFGDFLCKVVGQSFHLNLLCGSLLLACIGFDRYLAIVHAVPSMQSRRPKTVQKTCIILWLVCLVLSAPNVLFLSVEPSTNSSKLSCSFHRYGIHANNWFLFDRFINHTLCFFLPLAVMSYCYTAVVVTLRHSQKSQEKQSAIRLALLLTVVFCLCWLPYNITMLVDTMVVLGVVSNESCDSYTRLEQALLATSSLGYAHCCLNPFLYAFTGVRFRNDLLHIFSRWGCRRLCLPLIRAQGASQSSTSEGFTTSNSVII
ncbi:C-X-C chemokine receptor type 5 [Polymixia lowei]